MHYSLAWTLGMMRRSVITYSWWAATFQAPILALTIFWMLFTPSPGFAVAVLAFVAGVMAVRTEHFTPTEKVVWILVAGALCVIEFRALTKDRADHDKQEAEIRWQDASNRKQERMQFEKLLEAGTQIFHQEQTLSKRTIDTITGGNTYPSIFAVRSDDGQGWNLQLVANGKYNLAGTYITVMSHMQLPGVRQQWLSSKSQFVPSVLAHHSIGLALKIFPREMILMCIKSNLFHPTAHLWKC